MIGGVRTLVAAIKVRVDPIVSASPCFSGSDQVGYPQSVSTGCLPSNGYDIEQVLGMQTPVSDRRPAPSPLADWPVVDYY